jgi:hypothetical protein
MRGGLILAGSISRLVALEGGAAERRRKWTLLPGSRPAGGASDHYNRGPGIFRCGFFALAH